MYFIGGFFLLIYEVMHGNGIRREVSSSIINFDKIFESYRIFFVDIFFY